jgi:hypothetical protein
MSDVDDILNLANDYYDSCLVLIKNARIRKMPGGKYRVLSEKGKNLGESSNRAGAEKRLREVEYFKHRDSNGAEDEVLDLTDIDDFSYSSIMRKLRNKGSKEQVDLFMNIFKKNFDKAIKGKLQKPEKVALQNTVVKFNKTFKVKFPKKMVKSAAISEIGDPILVGKYLADIIRFTLARISPENRPKAIESLRNKFQNINELDLAHKNLPASAAIGQSITFVKHVLFNHDPKYIKEVLNSLVRSL